MNPDRYHDDPIADYFLTSHIVHENLAWALLQYLENKGLIEHDEFMKFFKDFLRKDIQGLKNKG